MSALEGAAKGEEEPAPGAMKPVNRVRQYIQLLYSRLRVHGGEWSKNRRRDAIYFSSFCCTFFSGVRQEKVDGTCLRCSQVHMFKLHLIAAVILHSHVKEKGVCDYCFTVHYSEGAWH